MERTIRMLALCSMMILSGCASHYVYQGELSALDSASHERAFLVYWTRTERPLWFDTAEGGVRLLTECSLNDLYFKEQENGIIFERREGDKGAGRDVPLKGTCGEIQSAAKIRDLAEGRLLLSVYCLPDFNDNPFADTAAMQYLKAKDGPYEIMISRKKTPDVEQHIPQRPACRGVK